MKVYEHYMKNNEYYDKVRQLLVRGYAGVDSINNIMERIEKDFDDDFIKNLIIFRKEFVTTWWKETYEMYLTQFYM